MVPPAMTDTTGLPASVVCVFSGGEMFFANCERRKSNLVLISSSLAVFGLKAALPPLRICPEDSITRDTRARMASPSTRNGGGCEYASKILVKPENSTHLAKSVAYSTARRSIKARSRLSSLPTVSFQSQCNMTTSPKYTGLSGGVQLFSNLFARTLVWL